MPPIVETILRARGGARRTSHALAAVILGTMVAGSAGAVEKTFVGMPSPADWLVDANWQPTGVPTAEDDVILGGMRTATLSSATTIRNFRIEGQGELVGNATLSVLGRFSWIEGNMRGQPTATTSVEGGADLPSGSGSRVLIRRVLDLGGGTTTMTGPQSVVGFNNGTINLGAAALFEASADGGSASQAFVGNGTFNNAGTFRKTEGNTGATRFQGVVFNNGGTLEVLSGAVELSGGTASSGSMFVVAAGAELRFTGAGDYDMESGSRVTGAGKVVVLSNPVNVFGEWDVATTEVTGSAINFASPVTIPNLILSDGQVEGDETLTVTDALIWTQGAMIGSGITNAENGMDLSGGSKTVSGRTINLNGGTATLTGASSEFDFFADAVFNNNAVFQVTPDVVGGDGNTFQGSGTFNNTGAFRVLGPVSFIDVPFVNSGTVEIAEVTQMTVSGGFRQTAGVTRLMMSSTLSSPTTPVEIEGGTLEGIGTIQGSLVNDGAVSPGLSPGPLFVTGGYTQTGRLLIEIGGRTALTEYDALEVDGAAALAGALEVTLIDGFVPEPGDEFTILTAASVTGDFDSTSGLVFGDGFGLAVRIEASAVVLEAVFEDCENTVDDDGDGNADCADPKCADLPACGVPSITPTPTATPTFTVGSPGPSRTPSRTATFSGPTPTRTASATGATVTATPTSTPTPSPTRAASCVGDCNSNDVVSIDELAKSVSLATRSVSASGCQASDVDGNDRISIDELVSAVNEALGGCP